ncbi:MAG: hypothetical protein ACOX6T_23660 [Myxococcales bacterium]|jgi:hypothetical protein
MNWVTMAVALFLAVMWIIALATNAAAAWFTWIVFAAAVLLFIAAIAGVSTMRRRTGQPI